MDGRRLGADHAPGRPDLGILRARFIGNAFVPGGQPKAPRTSAAAKIFRDDLPWRPKALLRARAAGTLPPAAFRLMAVRKGGEMTTESPEGPGTGSVPAPVAPALFVRMVIRPVSKVLNR
jgi:hypothetical protein